MRNIFFYEFYSNRRNNMQIKTSNTTFTGAFRLRPTEIKAQREIPELFTQGRQIFTDILEKGDQVIIVRDNYDKRIGKYIKENIVNDIEYYPEINTKMGLDSERPQELIDILKNKTKTCITDFQEMFSTIAKQKKAPKPLKTENVIENISNALRLNIEKPEIVSTNNSTIIRDSAKQRTIEVIAKVPETFYVHIKPDSIGEANTRCIINNKGQVVKYFETPNEIHKFYKIFRELKAKETNILSK